MAFIVVLYSQYVHLLGAERGNFGCLACFWRYYLPFLTMLSWLKLFLQYLGCKFGSVAVSKYFVGVFSPHFCIPCSANAVISRLMTVLSTNCMSNVYLANSYHGVGTKWCMNQTSKLARWETVKHHQARQLRAFRHAPSATLVEAWQL